MGTAALWARTVKAGPGRSRDLRIRREVFVASPKPGATVLASTYYTRPSGGALLSIQEIFTRSDTVDVATFRYSQDNGRTWQNGEEFATFGVRPSGKLRRAMRACTLDPASGRLLHFYCEAILPNDDPLEGFREWVVCVRVSEDGGYTYSDAAVLRGRWAADGRHLTWELSQKVVGDPKLSTRGMDEPTLGLLADGRVIMVLRGSNDKKPDVAGRRWVAYSADQGRTWTSPRPWAYTDGGSFFSPASSSQLVAHSSGRLFWLGNITPANPTGNRPRYPFVIGEVDRATGLLRKDTVRVVDDRAPNETALVALASGSSREDRETGDIILNLTRWGEHSTGDQMSAYNWTANAYLYRIPIA